MQRSPGARARWQQGSRPTEASAAPWWHWQPARRPGQQRQQLEALQLGPHQAQQLAHHLAGAGAGGLPQRQPRAGQQQPLGARAGQRQGPRPTEASAAPW
ncbi:hypothetical protein [uncultured Azohydromonas sp.]|uniref:hypothetical protein n=1 Tax=uncultured Azohydromonas sp. TaxID=487342 RepID=UPI00260D66DC|nr:hypothetical protein [uncultured Azohydromonas sp.]